MTILFIMLAGVLIGYKLLPGKFFKYNNLLQPLLILILIFCMGVSFGSRKNLLSELTTMGTLSLMLAVCAMAGSAFMVQTLTTWYKKHKKGGDCK